MPTSGSFGNFGSTTSSAWSVGTWTSQLLDISLLSPGDGSTPTWTSVSWKEVGVSDEDDRYVRVDILDSSKNTLYSDQVGVTQGLGFKAVDLSVLPLAATVDIYIRIKLFVRSGASIIVSELNVT